MFEISSSGNCCIEPKPRAPDFSSYGTKSCHATKHVRICKPPDGSKGLTKWNLIWNLICSTTATFTFPNLCHWNAALIILCDVPCFYETVCLVLMIQLLVAYCVLCKRFDVPYKSGIVIDVLSCGCLTAVVVYMLWCKPRTVFYHFSFGCWLFSTGVMDASMAHLASW